MKIHISTLGEGAKSVKLKAGSTVRELLQSKSAILPEGGNITLNGSKLEEYDGMKTKLHDDDVLVLHQKVYVDCYPPGKEPKHHRIPKQWWEDPIHD
jgi:molybdopterin converting factor small subunit